MIFPKQQRRLRNELNRKEFRELDLDLFLAWKKDGFDFLLDVIERRDGSPRQLQNAVLVAVRMRRWGRERYITLLPDLCTHDDVGVRTEALRLLVKWARCVKNHPEERVEGVNEARLHSIIEQASALGLGGNGACWVQEYLERFPAQ